MGRPYSREYQNELTDKIQEYEISADEVLNHLLGWVDSDTACAALEDFCRDYEIDLEEDEDD